MKKAVERAGLTRWYKAFNVLLVMALLVALLLMATARSFDGPERAGAYYLDIYAAVHGTTTESADLGIEASQLPRAGSDPVALCSVNW